MSDKKLRTPPGTLSFVNLFEIVEQKDDDGNMKQQYSTTIVWTPEQQKRPEMKALKAAALAVAIEKFGEKAPDMIRKNQIKWPFRDAGEKDEYGEPFVEGNVFASLKSYGSATKPPRQPGIVSLIPDPKNNNKPTPITDPDEVYSGILAWATVQPFAGTHPKGGKFVALSLHNVQKLADGERLDGRSRAEDDFEADMSKLAELPSSEANEDEDVDIAPQSEKKPAKRGKKGSTTRKASKPAPEPAPEPEDDDGEEDEEDDLSDLLGG